MHDLKLLRDGLDTLRDGLRRRGALDAMAPVVDRLVVLDRERRATIQATDEQKAARNAASEDVARRRRAGEDAHELIVHARVLGERISELEQGLKNTDAELAALLLELPNIPLADVPEGGAEASIVVRTWGTPRPAEGVRPHWEVGEALGILDLLRAAKVTGSGFVAMCGAGARLTRALMSFMLDMHTREHGYTEYWVPILVNRASMTGTGQLPKFEDDAYVTTDDLFLIPTAEVPLTNLYREEMLDGASLPLALTAYSPCFRREAGAHGKDTRGLIRVHQFDKVELVRYCAPEHSDAELERLTGHAEAVLQRLELPYRVLQLAAGDLGFAAAKTYDLEVWAPGVERWLEVSSCSLFTDFQARRAQIRFRPGPGEKPRYVHTLNGSGVAFPRTIIALLEHHQRADGTVSVPLALRPYFGDDVIR